MSHPFDRLPTEEQMNIVGSYAKTKRTVSGRVVYQWNEAGV